MLLQNRVDPFGRLHAVAAHGLFTGNRGVIHDPDKKLLLERRWTTKAWLVCDLVHPRAKLRDVFGRNAPNGGIGWTELFFLDEVTALAAGHRPCFYCRRPQASDFAARFGAAGATGRPRSVDMDGCLHLERFASGGMGKLLAPHQTAALPDGAMVAVEDRAFAMRGGKMLPWSFAGYGEASWPEDSTLALLLTPSSTVAALAAGYRPVWHTSAPA